MAAGADTAVQDTVQYRLFPAIPDEIGESQCGKYLEEVLDSYLVHLSKFLVEYIWQNEPFHLSIVATSTGAGPPHLVGKTCYGDNVEDEWFIVYILSQLTQKFPGLIASVCDADGEFLLIEAAQDLPRWLNPDTAENRVFLYRGKLHIIPQPETPAQITTLPAGKPQVPQALHCIREYPRLTVASDAIQKDIQRRLAGYPDKMDQFIHHAHAYIPAPLAAVLEKNPALVAPMVQAFYLRDPIDLKACVTMKHFRPGTRVLREVKFTKCLYAQLMQQRFMPDKRSGWNLPAPTNPKFKSQDLGMKLAHGAEILCANCRSDVANENGPSFPATNTRWQHFISALTEKGYFRGELEGSKLYSKLADDAKAFFYNSGNMADHDDTSSGSQILQLLRTANYDIEDMRKQEINLRPPDDDSWLDLTPEQLDDMLNKASDFAPKPDTFDMSGMADSMKAFVDNISSHEGAELPKSTSEEADIQFDPNSFIQTMQKMFEFEDSASDSSTDMSEYGSDDELGSTSSPPQVRPTPKAPPRPNKETNKSAQASPSKTSKSDTNDDTAEDFLGMREYMKRMDRELASTTIGESFEKKPVAPEKKPRPARPPPPRPNTAPRRPTTAPPPPPSKTAPRATMDEDLDMSDENEDDFEPVDIDLNMVKNLLESYSSQDGMAGPTSNMLGAMGLVLPKAKKK